MSTGAVGARTDPALLAHLYRRAGFGATREQLDRLGVQDYEDTVEFLLNPTPVAGVPDDILARYMGGEAPHAYTTRPKNIKNGKMNNLKNLKNRIDFY